MLSLQHARQGWASFGKFCVHRGNNSLLVDARALIFKYTEVKELPELNLKLHLITASSPLWTATLRTNPLPSEPWWGFVWPGGFAIAKFILQNRELFRKKNVLDFGSGCGVQGIAALMAGAEHVEFNDVDHWSHLVCEENARTNGFPAICSSSHNYLMDSDCCHDTIDIALAGDVFYEQGLAEQAFKWLKSLTNNGVTVLLGDPGRHFLPRNQLICLASYDLPQMLRDANYGMLRAHVWTLPSASSTPRRANNIEEPPLPIYSTTE